MEKLNHITVLWDFDGTLFDTYPVFTELFQHVLNEDAKPEHILEQLKITFSHAVQYFQLTDDQLKTMRLHLSEMPVDKFKPFPGLEQVLKSVGKNVIMTHKDREATEKILKHHGLRDYFADIVTGDDGFPRKPDATSYEYLHKRHQIDLVIGDRLLDIIPGKKIGAKTCLFQNKEAGADFYIEHYQDFYDKVGKFL